MLIYVCDVGAMLSDARAMHQRCTAKDAPQEMHRKAYNSSTESMIAFQ